MYRCTKRLWVAEQLARSRRITPPLDKEALRQRLRAIREDTAEHLDDLQGQLKSTLREQYGITPLEASTAKEAAESWSGWRRRMAKGCW